MMKSAAGEGARRQRPLGSSSRPRATEKPRLAWPGGCAMGIAVIVPCDHSFGWEAPVIHLGRGFFLSHDKMFMIEGVVLTYPSAMQEPVTASLPSHCSPREPKKPRPPRRGFFFFS